MHAYTPLKQPLLIYGTTAWIADNVNGSAGNTLAINAGRLKESGFFHSCMHLRTVRNCRGLKYF